MAAIQRRVEHLRQHGESSDTHLAAVFNGKRWSTVRSADITSSLRDHNNQTPGGIYTGRHQRALNAGWRRHGPPHGAHKYTHDAPHGQVAQRRNAALPTHDRSNIHGRAPGAHSLTWGLCDYPS